MQAQAKSAMKPIAVLATERAKYAVSSNIEVGAEYTRNNLKRSGTKLKGNDFSANVGYRF